MKHSLPHRSRLDIDIRLEAQSATLRENLRNMDAAVANLHDLTENVRKSDVREQALRDAMAKKGKQ